MFFSQTLLPVLFFASLINFAVLEGRKSILLISKFICVGFFSLIFLDYKIFVQV